MMRRSLPGVNAELAAAVQRVSDLYEQVPEQNRPDVTGEKWQALEAEIDHAAGGGDRDYITLAIERWEGHARRVLTAAARGSR